MANPTEIGNALRTVLLQNVWVHEWDVDDPKKVRKSVSGISYPANVATVMPVSMFQLTRESIDRSLTATLMYPMYVQYRFNRTIFPTVHSIPFNQLQSLYGYIATRIAFLTGDDILSINIPPRTTPITLSTSEGLGTNNDITSYSGDWIVNLYLDVVVSFLTDLTDYSYELWTAIQPESFTGVEVVAPFDNTPFIPQEINIEVHRGEIEFDVNDPDTHKLDTTIEIRNEPL